MSQAPPIPKPAENTPQPVNISADQAEKVLKEKKDVVVLDVRTPEEFSKGHIEGAKHLNYHDPDFAVKLAALDKNKTYIVHCQAGGRSSKTIEIMKDKQFQSVMHMSEGFKGWQEANKPVSVK
jgi:rhodanese-related sulfurtransferase